MQDVSIVESTTVARAWAGHPVSFSLVTRGDAQYAVFYDENRDITVAKRRIGDAVWDLAHPVGESPVFGARATPTRTGWDSHNYVSIGFDETNAIHLSGNMHNNPLLYFRTDRPGDIHSFRRLDRMTGERESQVTYPRFMNDRDGRLVFSYRDGRSGSGADFYNRFDSASRTWAPLIRTPLVDGREPIDGRTANAYAKGPTRGPDRLFHLIWVWRDTPACETNHTLSYARSRDMVNWETSDGRPLALPITPRTGEVVDPVPVNGGMINGNTLLGFDDRQRPIITYHKFDSQGRTQIYVARRETDGWRSVQASRWNYRWDFRGLGTIIFDVILSPVQIAADGRLYVSWWNRQDGTGGAYLDPSTLEPVGEYKAPPTYPAELLTPESKFPGMQVRWAEDGQCPFDKDFISHSPRSERYVLRWESLAEHRDHAPEGAPPPAGELRLFKLKVR